MNKQTKKISPRLGFTILELMIILAISGVTFTYSYVQLIRYKHGKTLNLERDKMSGLVQTARDRAVGQEQASKWGVHFENLVSTNNFYTIFYGDTYNPANKMETVYLSRGVLFTIPLSGQSLDIVFDKLTGKIPTALKVMIQNTFISGSLAEVNVSSTGVITSKTY